ncbi:MAG TPA: lysylphosphatidylglycerol synthase transmembrane domain-containing protein [Candidatus Syntrophosphaera sp.]|nr:lysylphosphatidylglycerol synthase transmembrane domain-containing protein [Candidatus Syntrophosphaera sp.]
MDATTRKKVWRVLSLALKLLVTALILYGLFRRMDFGKVWQNLLNQPIWLILAILGLAVLRHWWQYLAWQYSLQINPLFVLKRKEVFESYMIGQALRFAVPGSWGIMGKVAYVSNSSKAASMISCMLERIYVTWSIFVFASLALLYLPHGIPAWARWLLFIGLLTLPVWLYFVTYLNQRWARLRAGYIRYAPRLTLLMIGATLINHFQYWLMLNLNQAVPFWDVVKRMSLSHLSYSIPVTVAGLGLKESFAISLLSKIGLQAESIASTILTIFIINDVVPALIGAGIFLRMKGIR